MPAKPVIELAGAVKRRRDGERTFELRVPAFIVGRGERIALVGPNGSGKSTLIELLAVALAPDGVDGFRITDSGSGVTVDVAAAWRNRDDEKLTQIRARRFGYVQQSGGLLRFLSVRDNILLSARLADRGDADLDALSVDLGLSDKLDAKPDHLSGGERQKVMIARALIHRPSILVADEPTAALHPSVAESVMTMMANAADERGVALILATHAPELARAHGFQIVEPVTVVDGPSQVTAFQHWVAS